MITVIDKKRMIWHIQSTESMWKISYQTYYLLAYFIAYKQFSILDSFLVPIISYVGGFFCSFMPYHSLFIDHSNHLIITSSRFSFSRDESFILYPYFMCALFLLNSTVWIFSFRESHLERA